MPRKQKRDASATGQKSIHGGSTHGSSSKLALKNWQDVMDSEEEFFDNRDKILLDEGPARKRARKAREDEEFLDASDEEILALPSDQDDEEEEWADAGQDFGNALASDTDPDQEITGHKKPVHEDELDGWGSSRRDLYGDDEVETEADALAYEAEARRIQMTQFGGMGDADFAFGERTWHEPSAADQSSVPADAMVEVLPEVGIADGASAQERLKLLRQRHPEFEPLKQEFLSLQDEFTQAGLSKSQSPAAERQGSCISSIQYQALSSYLGVLTMYFALLTSTAADDGKRLAKPPNQLQAHDVMESLIQARTSWMLARGLREPRAVADMDALDSESEQGESKSAKPARAVRNSVKQRPRIQTAQAASMNRRAARLAQVEEEFSELDRMPLQTTRKAADGSRSTSMSTERQPLLEEHDDDPELDRFEAAEKLAKRKSLRFYTSQITQKAMRRNAKGMQVGGDTDIPVRATWKERQAKLEEAVQRRKSASEHRLTGSRADSRAGSDSDEYQRLASHAAKHKADRKQAATRAFAQQEADEQAGIADAQEYIGPDGKRKINYQIERNKGLAPHRKKEARNPRVKKRKKFEEKKRKLASIKPVYTGGPGKQGYQGEMTGIKSNLVRGIKLS